MGGKNKGSSAALEGIVVDLTDQVKGLHSLITTEIQDKKIWKEKAENLEEKYFKTLEGLKKDLLTFKSKLAEENKSMYSEFQS